MSGGSQDPAASGLSDVPEPQVLGEPRRSEAEVRGDGRVSRNLGDAAALVEPGHSREPEPSGPPAPASRTEGGGGESNDAGGSAKLLEFVQKLVLLIIGFVLTGLIGMAIAENLKRSFALEDFRIKTYQSDLEREQKIFEAISGLFDRRLFRMRRVVDAFETNMSPEMQIQRVNDYRSVFLEWNDALNKNRAYFYFYFCAAKTGGSGDGAAAATETTEAQRCRDRYDSAVSEFNGAHKLVQKLIEHSPDGAPKEAETVLNDLNVTVFFMDELMLQRMSQERESYERIMEGQSRWSAWLPAWLGGRGGQRVSTETRRGLLPAAREWNGGQ